MARILIGNIKGPAGKIVSVSATKGEPGTDPQVTNVGTESDAKLQFVIPEGQKGEQGLRGPTGPMPPLVNNLTTNQAGQGALDAAQGKALADKDTALQSAVDALNRNSTIKAYTMSDLQVTDIFDLSIEAGRYSINPSCKNTPVSTYAEAEISKNFDGNWRFIILKPTDRSAIYLNFYNGYADEPKWEGWVGEKLRPLPLE